MGYCPECGAEYDRAVVACPRCRAILVAEHPSRGGSPEVIHRVPDAAAGALLEGLLRHHGIRAVLRSTALPGYGLVRRDGSTSAWGEILVSPDDAAEARALIADYLLALERGGEVTDQDVDEGGEVEEDPGGG